MLISAAEKEREDDFVLRVTPTTFGTRLCKYESTTFSNKSYSGEIDESKRLKGVSATAPDGHIKYKCVVMVCAGWL